MVNRKKVMVGMSGGVDSSVAAYLLKENGYDVTGIMMTKKTPVAATTQSRSCFDGNDADNVNDAREVCERIGISLLTVDVSKEYAQSVMSYFKKEYLSGRTPNPCIQCNALIKFGLLPKLASDMVGEYDYFATGHYAIIKNNQKTGRYNLIRGKSDDKDQSYFLYRLSQQQLAKILFPLGEYQKDEIRAIAEKVGLHVYDKKDSQDFYSGKYGDLLGVKEKKGNIVDEKGNIVGHHLGFWNYTIGQRKGLGISASSPLYVVDIRADKNEVVVSESVLKEQCILTDVVYSSFADIGDDGITGWAKYRSAQKNPVKAKIIKNSDGNVMVMFKDKAKALTPGQSLVLYDDDGIIVCGGIIK